MMIVDIQKNVIVGGGHFEMSTPKLMLHRVQDKVDKFSHASSAEIDIQMNDEGEIVVCHDPQDRKKAIELRKFVSQYLTSVERLAINIKEDGIMEKAFQIISSFKGLKGKFFFFDMSIPQLVWAIDNNYPVAFRVSDVEVAHDIFKLYPKIQTIKIRIWIDWFGDDWDRYSFFIKRIVENYPGAEIYIVSPDLHKLPVDETFSYRMTQLKRNVWICTDNIGDYQWE